MVYRARMNRGIACLLLVVVLTQPWLNAWASCCPILAPAGAAAEQAGDPVQPPHHHQGRKLSLQADDEPRSTPEGCDAHACAGCQAGACGHACYAIPRGSMTPGAAGSIHAGTPGDAAEPAAGFDQSPLRPPSIS